MLKITFYPNDEARIVGCYLDSFTKMRSFGVANVSHAKAEEVKEEMAQSCNDGTIEARIITIRKAGAYTIPKLDRVNDVFNQLT